MKAYLKYIIYLIFGTLLFPAASFAAIARDSNLVWDNAGPATSDTHAFNNVAGTIMFVSFRINSTSVHANTMTYGGDSLTAVAGTYSHPTTGLGSTEWWCLVNPKTGSNNLVTNWTPSTNAEFNIQTYTGAAATCTPDSVAIDSVSAVNNRSVTLTINTPNAWVAAFVHTNGGVPVVNTGLVLWPPVNDGAELWGDSNGYATLSASSFTVGGRRSDGSTGLFNLSAFSFDPASSGSASYSSKVNGIIPSKINGITPVKINGI